MKQELNLLKNETNERAPSRLSAPRWILQESRRLMNQSERASSDIHLAGKY